MKKLRKSNTLKRILALLSTIVALIACLSLTTFAVSSSPGYSFYPVPFDETTVDEYNPGGTVISYDIFDGSGVTIYSKAQGAVGFDVPVNIDTSILPTDLVSYDFTLYWDDGDYTPRQLVAFAYGAWQTEGDRTMAYALSGVTFALDMNETASGGTLRVYKTSSFTNDYSNVLSTSVALYDGHLPVRLVFDVQSGVCDIYVLQNVSSESLAFLGSYSFAYLATNNALSTFRYGVYDSLDNLTVGISEARYNIFDDEYSAEIFQNGYNEGKRIGFDEGFDEGDRYGFNRGYKDGKDDGLEIGYADGYRDGSDSAGGYIDIPLIFDSLFSGTSSILGGFLDWEIFGINVLGVLVSILVVVIVVFIVKKLRS